MKAAYFHCIGGASGDMILGALVDVGLSLETLKTQLAAQLPVDGYSITAQAAQRGGITGTMVTVSLEESNPRHRSLRDIETIISGSSLPHPVKGNATKVFQALAKAEAKVHRIPTEQVEFHEVGATDALVDVVGAILGLHLLGVEQVFCSALPTGTGVVSSSHGVLPLPAPATLELIARAKAPVRTPPPGYPEGELVTPTAAAILTTLASFDSPVLRLERTGYGAGHKVFPHVPNLLGLWIGEREGAYPSRELVLVETNIDDMTAELFGYLMERLFQIGARDVWFTPIQMKKNRPAVMVSVLAAPSEQQKVLDTLFRETSTLGARVRSVDRHEVEREIVPFESSLGVVGVKIKRLGGKIVALSPEYEECRELAMRHGMSLQEVYRIVEKEAGEKLIG